MSLFGPEATRSAMESDRLWHFEQAGLSVVETACFAVEGNEVGFVVNVQPLTSLGGNVFCKCFDDCRSNTEVLIARGDHGVQEKCVCPTVPDCVDEANQSAAAECADPTHAVAV